jgi:hypothetical protein
MFGWKSKDPVAKLEKEYKAKLEEARDTQRSGDIRGYAALMSQAEEIGKRLEEEKAKKA